MSDETRTAKPALRVFDEVYGHTEASVCSNEVLCGWRPMEEAIKDGKCERVLLKFEGGEVSVGYWDLYYAEGGRGYNGNEAWIEPCSGEQLDLHYGPPVGWLPLYEAT